MILEDEHVTHLKPWLVRTLEPICDAEPGALADYVLALLKHETPTENELRREMEMQLDEFLEKECPTFLDTLFTVLRTKSYLPYTTASSSSPKSTETGIPIPVDGLLSPTSSRKRSLEEDENRPASKAARLTTDPQSSRYGNSRGDSRAWTHRDSNPSMGNGAVYMNGRRPSNYEPPDHKRGICRDYYNRGYCTRGAQCKYRHGDDALIPGPLFAANGVANGLMPMLPMFGMTGPAAYDPHESQMDMRGNNPPLIPHGNTNMFMHHGELPVIQDLTPEVHPNAVTPHPNQQPNQHTHPHHQPPMDNPQKTYPPDVDMTDSSRKQQHRPPRTVPGTFNNDAPNFRPERRKDKTLVMEKIPEDKLNLEHVNDWFKRFGTVTNVAIDKATAKALISFSTHEEAYAAWKSEDAVFNNRFVKLFWHRPMEGHGQLGSRLLAASAPAIAKLSQETTVAPAPAPAPPTSTTSQPTPSRKSLPSAALTAKQQLLEQQIAEQKSLMVSLETATPEEKKEIMAKLRKLAENMKSAGSPTQPPTTGSSAERDRQTLERLDKELDLHNATGAAEGEDDSPEGLKAKLARLKAEAASLGIPVDAGPASGSSYRPYRGRFRGSRGYPRGMMRGGPPRSSMKLDNRPKKLLVKGVSADKLQVLQDWYETTGQVELLTQAENGDIVISFKNRAAAEQGLTKGSNVPTIGSVQVTWFTGTDPVPSTQNNTSPPEASSPESRRDQTPEADQHSLHEDEEIVATGWGGDGEDGMGML